MKKIITIIIMAILCISLRSQMVSALSIDEIIFTVPKAEVTVIVNGAAETFGTDISAACTAYAAVYNTDGKLLSVGCADISDNQVAVSINIYNPSLPTNYIIKLFLLDNNSKPLSANYSRTN